MSDIEERGPSRKVGRSYKRNQNVSRSCIEGHSVNPYSQSCEVSNVVSICQKRKQTFDVEGSVKEKVVTNTSNKWISCSFVNEKRHKKDTGLSLEQQGTTSANSAYFSETANFGRDGSKSSGRDLTRVCNPSLPQNDANTDRKRKGHSTDTTLNNLSDHADSAPFITSTSGKTKMTCKTRQSKLTIEEELNNSDSILADLDIPELNNTKVLNRKTTNVQSLSKTSDVKRKSKNLRNGSDSLKSNIKDCRQGNSCASSEEDLFDESFEDCDLVSQIENVEVKNCRQSDTTNKSIGENLIAPSKLCQNSNSDSVQNLNKNSVSEFVQTNANLSKVKTNENNSENSRLKESHSYTLNVKPEQCHTPKTSTGLGSLKDRIKQRLQENTGITSSQSPGMVTERRRSALIQTVEIEAEKERSLRQDTDIGPFYGLPTKVKELFKTQRGIEKLYDWQDECLNLPAIKERRNLIYCLPTSGGKTLVAEILILQELLCKGRDALLVLPFVSIVQEKVKVMSQLAVELDFLVEEYAGPKGKFPPIKRRSKRSLLIATMEKAHSLVNSLMEQGRISSLGLVVVDELHMIGEGGSRGSTLEMLLLKLVQSQSDLQIVGMSATLSNIQDLQTFLKADMYSNDFRPVKLTEYVKVKDNIYEVQGDMKCAEDQLVHSRTVTFEYPPDMARMDPDHLLGLVLEVIPNNSCLLFCATKKNCENVAMMLCKLMVKHKRELSNVCKAQRKALLKELYNDGESKICPILQYTVHFGVAYHHSGLTMDERKLIEDAYSEGVLCLLTCTSTLAAGVNLPAKRVILRSPYVATQLLSRSQYKQMVGRAGRAGIDSSGESILILNDKDRHKALDILSGPIESCHSSLNYDEGKGIRSLVLSAIGLQIVKTTQDVFTMMGHTLLSVQSNVLDVDINNVTKESLQKLLDNGLVIQKRSLSQEKSDSTMHNLEVTPLGRATFKGSVDIDYASMLYTDLQKGEESLVLSSYLHLLYLVTPYDTPNNISPSWMTYFQVMMALNPVELKVAELIGVPESYVAKKVSGQNSRQAVNEFTVRRFYLTLMLYDLWKQRTVWEVAEKFEQPRGFIQNLLSSAASFASCILRFVQELEEFWPYQELLGNFVKRLAYCVSAELIPLMEIPGVKLGRAKQLYCTGFRSLSLVASADPDDIVRAIKQIPRKVARQIVASAKVLLDEKAEALLEEVEELVSVPVGLEPIHQDNYTIHTLPATSPYIDSVPSSLSSIGSQQD